jgi:hypothetical protein
MDAARTASSARWLFGPVPDLFLGCGLLYLALFAAFVAAGAEIRSLQAHWVFPALILLFSGPHYGATLVRVYEQRAERQRYAIFSVYATVLVAAAFVAGLYDAIVASWLLTVYLTWSPWHYTGQNYGIGVMFLRRRGINVTPGIKGWLYASFVLSYALTFLMIHGGSGEATVVPATGSDVRFLPLGFPRALANPVLLALGAAYLVSFGGFARLLLRQASWRDAGPTAALMLTQALWFPVPLGFQHLSWAANVEPLSLGLRGHYALWVVLGHAVQYLWVTTYYARASAEWRGYLPYFGKVLATGTAVWTLPYVVFGPDALGPLSTDAGLLLLVTSAINIHHFILDGAIWKLRHMRIANVLLRPSEAASAAAGVGERPQASWTRRLVWHTAIACLGIGVFVFWQEQFSYQSAFGRGDFGRASAVLDRLGWVGKDSATARLAVGSQLLQRGNLDGARHELERSLALRETPDGYALIGMMAEHEQDARGALSAYERALALDPNRRDLLMRAGKVQLALGQNEQARALLDRAAALAAGQSAQGEAAAGLPTQKGGERALY